MYKVFFNDRTVYFVEDYSIVDGEKKVQMHAYKNRRSLFITLEQFVSSGGISKLYLSHHDLPFLANEFRAYFLYIEAGGGLVFNSKDKFLVLKRNGKWDLPKGKLEKGEDFEKAALREVKEETGLKKLETVQPISSTYHTYRVSNQWVLKRTQWFEMLYRGKNKPVLELQEGITEYKWVQPGETAFIRRKSYGSILDVLRIREVL